MEGFLMTITMSDLNNSLYNDKEYLYLKFHSSLTWDFANVVYRGYLLPYHMYYGSLQQMFEKGV